MRLLFLHGAHPADKVGGAELQAWLLAQELARRNEVMFVALRGGQPGYFEEQGGVGVIRVNGQAGGRRSGMPKVYRIIQEWAPDMIYLRMFDYVPYMAFTSRLLSIPVIYHVSSMFNCTWNPDRSIVRGGKWLRHLINFQGLRMLSGIVCQTEEQLMTLARHVSMPMRVVRNSMVGEFSGARGVDDGADRVVLWVGNIKAVKRPMVFVRAAQMLRDHGIKFLMIGAPQDKELAGEVVAATQQLDNLAFIPGVAPEEIDEYFSRAALLVNTSVVEGYPNVFVQAMQHAVPIVSLGIDPDNILSNCNVGYSVADEHGLVEEILRFWVDPPHLTSHLEANSQKCIERYFLLEKNAAVLEEFMLELV